MLSRPCGEASESIDVESVVRLASTNNWLSDQADHSDLSDKNKIYVVVLTERCDEGPALLAFKSAGPSLLLKTIANRS